MLVLQRKLNESIAIEGGITVTVTDINPRRNTVRLGIEAPKHLWVHRQEVAEAIERENQRSRNNQPGD